MSAGALIKFKRTGGDRIERIECLRETESSVFFARTVRGIKPRPEERRVAKMSDYESYHDTWAEAHAYLIKKAEGSVASARLALEAANGELGNIKGMKPPKESV